MLSSLFFYILQGGVVKIYTGLHKKYSTEHRKKNYKLSMVVLTSFAASFCKNKIFFIFNSDFSEQDKNK